MKQNISIEQLLELTEEQFESLFEILQWKPLYWNGKTGLERNAVLQDKLCDILNIGQMIEILEINKETYQVSNLLLEEKEHFVILHIHKTAFKSAELVDALWSAVKSIL